MSVDVVEHDPDEHDDWNALLGRSSMGTFFHTDGALSVIERHTDGTLHRLVGYKGQEPVGVFPVFELRKAGVRAAVSPPPGLGLLYMGPVLIENASLKRRKRERAARRFVEGALEWLDERVSPRYQRFCTPVGFDDPRPFGWNEFDTSPLFTYRLPLDRDLETIEDSFSKSLRRYLDPDEDDRYEIDVGGEDAVRFVHEQVAARYEAQGKSYAVPLDFLLDLYRELGTERVRPYLATVDGEVASGVVVLDDGSTVYYSEGGGKPDVDFPINDLLHWRIIRDAHERECDTYDLYGANTRRIAKYKAKFNPELATYFEAERGSKLVGTAAKLYRRYR